MIGVALSTVIDRVGAVRTLVVGLLVVATGTVLGGLTTAGAQLLVTTAIEGTGYVAVVVAAPTLIARAATPADSGLALGLRGMYMPSGQAIMAITAPVLLAAWTWRGLWFANATLLVVGAVAACSTTREREALVSTSIVVVPSGLIEDGSVSRPQVGDTFGAPLTFIRDPYWRSLFHKFRGKVEREELEPPNSWRESTHWANIGSSIRTPPPLLVRVGSITARADDPELTVGCYEIVGLFHASYDIEVGPTVPITSGTVRRVRLVTQALDRKTEAADWRIADREPPRFSDVHASPRFFNMPPERKTPGAIDRESESGARDGYLAGKTEDRDQLSKWNEYGVVIDLDVTDR